MLAPYNVLTTPSQTTLSGQALVLFQTTLARMNSDGVGAVEFSDGFFADVCPNLNAARYAVCPELIDPSL